MLNVVSTKTADEIIADAFNGYSVNEEQVPLAEALGRVLSRDIVSTENVPSFNRVTVDGYAIKASDTFGSSESLPSQLELVGEVLMGKKAPGEIQSGTCMKISTGGMLPNGADGAVMVENTEEAFDGSVLVYKAVSPFENVTKKGDDVSEGQTVLKKGTAISSKHIGVLASLGIDKINCFKQVRVGIISSGDEVIKISETPLYGQVRDVNSHILSALCRETGCDCTEYGIVPDNYGELYSKTKKAAEECDIILLSGGSSAGARDMTVKVINNLGEVFIHGIAMKPGKPTIVGKIGKKAVFGLPGHPAAAYFTALRFVVPLIKEYYSLENKSRTEKAVTAENISSNHGREEFIPVTLKNATAHPIFRKSGVISMLTQADGYIVIDRDKEGLKKGEAVEVRMF